MRPALLLVLVLLGAALTACSSSPEESPEPDGTGTPAAFDERSVRSGLAGIFAGDDPGRRDRDAGRCFADRLLRTATPEQLREGGLVADDGTLVDRLPSLPEDLAGTVADAQLACTDVVDSSTRALTSVRKGDLDGEAYAACLAERLPDDAQREALVATLTGEWDDPALGRLAEAQVACAGEQDGR